MNEYLAIGVDRELPANEWWGLMREQYPDLTRALERDGHAIIRESDLDGLNELVSWMWVGEPPYSPCPLTVLGSDGEGWSSVVSS